jgi:adenylate cyclase
LKPDPTPIQAWLIVAGLAGEPLPQLFDGFCNRLVAAGVPLARGYVSTATLHPLLWATGIVWQQGRIIDSVDINYGFETRTAWLTSPFRHMLESRTWKLHRRLTGEGALLDYPVLLEFRETGMSEWLGLFYGFGWGLRHHQVEELGVIFSWTTDHPDGWTVAELSLLEELSAALALAVKASTGFGTTRDLLATYLGGDAADRVISGQVQRGSVTRIKAFILYADLRGFTDFAESTAPDEVVQRLNDYFDCIGEPIRAAGGEVLKFLGDGLLAVFLENAGQDRSAVAARTLSAAQNILAEVHELNARGSSAGRQALTVDLGLHEGEVTYGNVGTIDRLDFTVIGPAVNEASRLEGLCKELDVSLLISDSFVRAAPTLRQRLKSLGHRKLRGVREPREVFTSASQP